MKVILDYVPNHTSDRHPWFQESRSSRAALKRDWYIWRDPAPNGGPPNNWTSRFGGPAWTRDAATGQYYYHAFLPEQLLAVQPKKFASVPREIKVIVVGRCAGPNRLGGAELALTIGADTTARMQMDAAAARALVGELARRLNAQRHRVYEEAID